LTSENITLTYKKESIVYDYWTFKINNIDFIVLFVNDSTLRISYIYKRTPIPTKLFLKIIVDTFNEVRLFTKLTLGDTSKIMIDTETGKIEISLFKIKILQTAHTWYESFGFKNDKLEEKRGLINGFIDSRLIDIMGEEFVLKYNLSGYRDIANITIKDFISILLTSGNTNIKDIINSIFDKLTEFSGIRDQGEYIQFYMGL